MLLNSVNHSSTYRLTKYGRFPAWSIFILLILQNRLCVDHHRSTTRGPRTWRCRAGSGPAQDCASAGPGPAGPLAGPEKARRLWVAGPHLVISYCLYTIYCVFCNSVKIDHAEINHIWTTELKMKQQSAGMCVSIWLAMPSGEGLHNNNSCRRFGVLRFDPPEAALLNITESRLQLKRRFFYNEYVNLYVFLLFIYWCQLDLIKFN